MSSRRQPQPQHHQRRTPTAVITVIIIVTSLSLFNLYIGYGVGTTRSSDNDDVDVSYILNNNLDALIKQNLDEDVSFRNQEDRDQSSSIMNAILNNENDEAFVHNSNFSMPDKTAVTHSPSPMPIIDAKDENEINNESSQKKKLNVVVLYPDDWRHDMMSSENPLLKTPFMDSLAAEGMRFTQNCVTTSICWISRATLFTGQWLSRHQSYKLKCPHFSWNMSRWSKTWPYLLQKKANYYVGHIGKWQYYDMNNLRNNRFNYTREFEGKHWERFRGKEMLSSDRAAIEAIDFLQSRPKELPFAMTVAFYPPKPIGTSNEPGGQWFPSKETLSLFQNITIPEPYNMTDSFYRLPAYLKGKRSEARNRWKNRYSTPQHYQAAMKRVYALVNGLDTSMKSIVEELKKEGIYNDTMIIITADNGMFHGAHGLAGKWYPYQESIRVPLIIKDPRMPKKAVGTTNDLLTLNVDLAETILGAAGLLPDPSMQGRDISEIYLPKMDSKGTTALERKPWRTDFFYEFHVPDHESILYPSTAVVKKNWKYIRWGSERNINEQLFHLSSDPLELNDLATKHEYSRILHHLKKRHIELASEIRDPSQEKLECTRITQTI